MLENYLSKLLVSRFGRYLKLDNEKLRVAAWKGDVELRDVDILADSLSDTLDGPVKVVCGNVGHFHFHVPWTALGSRPVEFVIENVTILLAPVDTWKMDPRERRRRARYAKMMKVEKKMFRQRQEETVAAATSAAASMGGKKNPGPGFWEHLISKVFYNIQVIVRRIHVRYEDSTTYPGRSMSLGLTLNEVTATMANSDWNVLFSQVGSGCMYKLINIEDLGLYFDTSSTVENNGGVPLSSSAQVGEGGATAADMQKSVHHSNSNSMGEEAPWQQQLLSFEEEEHRHDYVLFPLSGSARLSLGQNDVFIDLYLPSMGIHLSTDQLTRVHAMHLALKDFERWAKIFRHRPFSPPMKDPRGWWKYAVWCITFARRGGAVRRKLDWLDVAQLLRKRKEYVRLYMERLQGRLTPSDYQDYMRMEEELSVNEIVAFRKTAESELQLARRSSIIRGNSCGRVASPDGGGRRGVGATTTTFGGDDSNSSSSQQEHPIQDEVVVDSSRGNRAIGFLGLLFGYRKQNHQLLRQEQENNNGREELPDIGGDDELSEYDRKTIEKEVLEAFAMGDESSKDNGGLSNLVAILTLNNATLTIVEGSTPCLRTDWDTKLRFSGFIGGGGQRGDGEPSWKIEATLGGLHIFDPSIIGENGVSTVVRRKRSCLNNNCVENSVEETVQIGDFSVVETGTVTISYSPGGGHDENVAGGGGETIDKRRQGPLVDINLKIAAHEFTYNPRCFIRTMAVFKSSSELRAVVNEARYRFGDVHSHAYSVAYSFVRGLAFSSGERGGGGVGVVVDKKLPPLSSSTSTISGGDTGTTTSNTAGAADFKFQRHIPPPTPSSDDTTSHHPITTRSCNVAFRATIHIDAPLIMVLESPDNLKDGNGQLLVIDLGCVNLSPNDGTKSGKTAAAAHHHPLGWMLNLLGLEVFVLPDAQLFLLCSSNNGPSSRSSIIRSSRPLIEHLDLTFNIVPNFEPISGRLTHLLISGDLPRLIIHLYRSTFHLLRRMFNNVTIVEEKNGNSKVVHKSNVKKEEDEEEDHPPPVLLSGQQQLLLTEMMLPPLDDDDDNATELSCSTRTTACSFPVHHQQHGGFDSSGEFIGGDATSLGGASVGSLCSLRVQQNGVKASLFEAVAEVELMDELAEHEDREEQLRAEAKRQVAAESESWGRIVIELVFSLHLTLIHIVKDETATTNRSSINSSSSHCSSSTGEGIANIGGNPNAGCRLLCTQLRQLTVQSTFISCARAESSITSITLGGMVVDDEFQNAGASFKPLMRICPSRSASVSDSSQCPLSLVGRRRLRRQSQHNPNIDDDDTVEEVVGGCDGSRDAAISFSREGNASPLLKIGFLNVNWNPETISNVVEFVSIIGVARLHGGGRGSTTTSLPPARYPSGSSETKLAAAAGASSTYVMGLPVSRIEMIGAEINLNKERERRHLAMVDLGPLSLEYCRGSGEKKPQQQELKAEIIGFCMSVNYGDEICHKNWCELVRGSKASCLVTVCGSSRGGKVGEKNNVSSKMAMTHNDDRRPPFRLELINSRVVYMQQPWLECLDYISCAVLGSAIWKHWFSTPPPPTEMEDSSFTEDVLLRNEKGMMGNGDVDPTIGYETAKEEMRSSYMKCDDCPDPHVVSLSTPLPLDAVMNTTLSVKASDLRLIIPCSNISNDDGIEVFTPCLSVKLKRELGDGRRRTVWKMNINDANATFFQHLSLTTKNELATITTTPTAVQFRTTTTNKNNNLGSSLLNYTPYSTVVTGVGIVLNVGSNNGTTDFNGTVTGGNDLKITLQDLKFLRKMLRENFGAPPIEYSSCLRPDDKNDGPPGPMLLNSSPPPQIVYNYAKSTMTSQQGGGGGTYVASIHFVDLRLELANKVVKIFRNNKNQEDEEEDSSPPYNDNNNGDSGDEKRNNKTSDELIARMSCDCLTWNISWSPNGRCLSIKLECPRFLVPTAINEDENIIHWGKEGLLLYPYHPPHNKGGGPSHNKHNSHQPFVYVESCWFTQENRGSCCGNDNATTILPFSVVHKIKLSEVSVIADKEKWMKFIKILSSTSSMSSKDEEDSIQVRGGIQIQSPPPPLTSVVFCVID